MFTMFEEQPEANNIGGFIKESVELSECDDNEELHSVLHDYYEGPFVAPSNPSAKPKTVMEEEIKEESKEEPPKKTEKPQTAEKEKEKPVVIEPN